MITKKKRTEFIISLFKDCDSSMIHCDGYWVKVSIWGMCGYSNKLEEFIKILGIIKKLPYIESSWEVWRGCGYYDDTDDITLNFKIDKEKVKEYLKSLNNRKNV